MVLAIGLWHVVLTALPGQIVYAESVILAGRMVAPDGSLVEGVAVVVADGKIKAVGSVDDYVDRDGDEATERRSDEGKKGEGESATGVIDRRDAVLCPGLIDAYSSLGVVGGDVRTILAIDPAASARDAIDVRHRDFRAALRAGVTAALVCPAPNNIIGGVGVVVRLGVNQTHRRPQGATLQRALLERTDGPLTFALGSSALSYSREPTSRMGAIHLLRDALQRAGRGEGHQRLVSFVQGDLAGLIVCERAEDVSAALRTFSLEHGSLRIVHTAQASEVAQEVADYSSDTIMLVGPYTFDTSPRVLGGAAALRKAGVQVALVGRLPAQHMESLRLSAALAVRYGMKADDARAAITSVAAKAIGLADRTGSIAPGLDADFVIFSGDPLRMDSRVLEVYRKGVRVYDAAME